MYSNPGAPQTHVTDIHFAQKAHVQQFAEPEPELCVLFSPVQVRTDFPNRTLPSLPWAVNPDPGPSPPPVSFIPPPTNSEPVWEGGDGGGNGSRSPQQNSPPGAYAYVIVSRVADRDACGTGRRADTAMAQRWTPYYLQLNRAAEIGA
ncbi:hypothetical protein B0H10DRAFT_1947180 [Mycena sp. CBHHK59/15]|nr:hypothetical protein B0H10DRAFT_1947180 [Mycena sp. CBHHK59/15]